MNKVKSLILVFFLVSVAHAHPGRTDSVGCHTCRTNCSKWGLSSGEYHCHNSKGLPQPKEPIRSHYGENGGSVELWPEYKNPSLPVSRVSQLGSASSITYDLARGMENNQVLKLQQVLARYPEIYPEGSVTGYFGSATEQAVKRFQKMHNLDAVGYTGPKTRKLLNAIK